VPVLAPIGYPNWHLWYDGLVNPRTQKIQDMTTAAGLVDLSYGGRLLLVVLLGYANRGGWAVPSVDRLLGDLGFSRRVFYRCLAELRGAGVVRVSKRSGGRANQYEVSVAGFDRERVSTGEPTIDEARVLQVAEKGVIVFPL